MPVTADIVASYRGPRPVMRRLLAMGENEGRALAIIMAACTVTFISQWPRLAREAHLTGQELNPLLGGALFGWLFIAPLVFYAFALISHLISRAFGASGTPFGSRLALFWAFLAASPLLLLHGMVAGFIGPGTGLTVLGAIWAVVFLWFWVSNQREAGWGTS